MSSGEHPTIPMPEPTKELIRELKATMRRERRAARLEFFKRALLAGICVYTVLGATAGLVALGIVLWRYFR